MQPLGTFEFTVAVFAVVVLPVLILWQLLSRRPIRTPTDYFRALRGGPAAWASLAAQAALVAWGASLLAAHYGLMPAAYADPAAVFTLLVFILVCSIEVGVKVWDAWVARRTERDAGR